MEEPGESTKTISYSNIHGEWEKRKISLWGAAKAFISQLRPGQDMTRVTIPSLFLRPYSILEEISARMVGNIDKLQPISDMKDPADRLRVIATWLLTSARSESFNHKPYNPIIGEEHKAKFQLEDGSMLFFLAEQVRHHPPISAFYGTIPDKGVSVEGNSNFSVTFNGNSVTVTMLGEMRIRVQLASGEVELYRLSKCVPDILIQNVIFGTKYIAWLGEIAIECEQSGLSGAVKFVPTSKGYNDVTGSIFRRVSGQEDDVVFYIKGNTEKEIKLSTDKKMKQNVEQIVDYKNIHINIPEYPALEDMPDNSSIKLWMEVTKAIIENDMVTADAKKSVIEQHQRDIRATEGERLEAQHFRELKENIWEIKNPDWYLTSPDINPPKKA